MGTYAQIQLRGVNEQRSRDLCRQVLTQWQEFESVLSTYRDDSEISRVNQLAAAEKVPVSPRTWYVLEQSLAYSKRTDGAFDITVAPLIALWKKAAKQNQLPSESELKQVLTRVGYQKIVMLPEAEAISFAADGVKINVNAIAKGYAVDLAVELLQRNHVPAGMVDIGGEIRCFNQSGDKDWIIGIQDPYIEEVDNIQTAKATWRLCLRDVAVATSGNYRRYVTIQDHRLSHIIDPRTGWPVDTLPSVTVIGPRTMDVDALATAISVMGLDAGLALVEELNQIEVMIVSGNKENMQVFRSSGFRKYECP
jgi:thiamine biosynthesis lipoprotein